jgi:8-oxo-dGTP pyrophosphatase MutT (NUDIX family)
MDTLISAAGFLLFRDTPEGRRWLLLQNRRRGDWGFPKGHAEPGESVLATARRECAEETGIEALEVVGVCESISYPAERGLKTVSYFPARSSQETVRLSREHTAHAWLAEDEVAQRLRHANLRGLFLLVAERLRC